MESSLSPTLRTLLARRDLRLSLVSDEWMLADGALDRPMRWVHSSDLTDPTPFLADDLVLLTTGTQFRVGDVAGVASYVARLAERGVNGLGFGSGVHSQGIPRELVDACAAQGLALFEVPYDVPFIAIARGHAEAIAAQTYARRTWALEAQRALALAALRPKGLDATIAELGRRLEVWAGMFDAAGALVSSHPRDALPTPVLDELSARVGDVLTRTLEAGQTLTIDEHTLMLFTVGRGGHLRGVIALAIDGLDPEARSLVTSVIAMAGLAMEQSAQLERSRRRLHTQLLGSLLADDPALARRVLGALPPGPVVVAIAADAPVTPLTDWWERHRSEHGTHVFIAESADGVTMCVSAADERLLDEVAERFGIRIGVSAPAAYDAFARANAQAMVALRQSDAPGAIRYGDTVSSSILTALAGDEARLVATSRLAPLRDHDASTGGDLEYSLRTWLEHDTRAESAAAALGVHRHTLRSRIAQAGGLLGVDLSSFPARAEVWAALRVASER